MEKLIEKLAIERNRLFVGRSAELDMIHQWIGSLNAPTQVLFVSGIGGIGKTSFMMRALDIAMLANVRTMWIDGRMCTETPTGFMEALFDHMKTIEELPSQRETSLHNLIHEISKGRTLLCIDNYDAILKIDGWLREVFLPRLPSTGVLMLFVSRQNLSESWQHDLAWRNRVSHIELPPLNRQEVTQYGFRTGIKKSVDIERLHTESQGLPLALALTSEKLTLVGQEAWPISLRICAELLREVVSPDLQEVLDLLCILPQATLKQIRRLARSPLNASRLLQLSRISFVRPTAYGFALHDVARHYLMEDFMRRDLERVRSLRKHIVYELVRELQSSDDIERSKHISMLITTCRDAFQLDAVAVFAHDPKQMQMEPFHQQDLPYLKRILQEQASYAVSINTDLVVLQELAEQFPDCIRVFRSKDGTPLAFVAGFYLYDKTTKFHEKHFPEVLEKAYPHEIDTMRTQTIEQANTFYHLLAAASENDPEYRFQQLIGIILADSLLVRSAGVRLVMINTYEGITAILVRLGYKMRPLAGLPDGHPFQYASVRELDWQTSDFGAQILELFECEPRDDKKPSPTNISDKSMISALPLVKDLNRLTQTELAHILGLTGTDLQHAIDQLLWGDPVYPLDQRMQLVLRQLSEAAHLTAEDAADRLHVSRATYFRIRRDALSAMKELLLR
ncbi:hypothetical protein [Paenibacillus roseipurpureus]|uniref:NB-ARC domain-containing protein n=1 Tax=Paenibacillus roseopurpureus TaxID=2918901 RepID=A0AA96RKN5_9BACL|nr:hypothetical protein [Paenibacillus sp. MBLB1832]WNR44539.1 hypothetical protein MJB10_26355 [Paenibacillus sp. MBLB1832]